MDYYLPRSNHLPRPLTFEIFSLKNQAKNYDDFIFKN